MEKKLHLKQARLQAKYPKAEIEVWSMDEHRLGLKPIQRRVWEQQAEQPMAREFIYFFCLLILLNYSLLNVCGLSPMNQLPIALSSR